MFRGLHTGLLCSDETHLRTHHFLLGHTLQAPTRRAGQPDFCRAAVQGVRHIPQPQGPSSKVVTSLSCKLP